MQSVDPKTVMLRGDRYVAGMLAADQLPFAFDLRQTVFRGHQTDGDDRDPHDRTALHFGVWDAACPTQVLCAFRVSMHFDHDSLLRGYCGQRYDLGGVARTGWKIAELGRFCISPNCADPDVLRMAWGSLTRLVVAHEIDALIGTSSFPGTRPTDHGDTLGALIGAQSNGAGANGGEGQVLQNAQHINVAIVPNPTAKLRLAALPPLLRTYLSMGAWFSTHYVEDHDLNTHHIFTCVEIAKIPETRARLLRRAAGLIDDSVTSP